MKKFLCAILAICMLCGASAFVGCKKDDGGNGSSVIDDRVPVPPEWG